MTAIPRSYAVTVLLGWVVLAAAGHWQAAQREIPAGIAWPIVAACLLEFAFYLVAAFPRLREQLSERLSVTALSVAMAATAVLPYCVYSLGTGVFVTDSFLRLVLLGAFLPFWYVYRPPTWVSDIAILVLLVWVRLSGFFGFVYVSPHPSVPSLEFLGQLMLIRHALLVFLLIREVRGTGFGFWPSAAEWRTGLRWFALAVFVLLPVSVGIGFVRFEPSTAALWRAPLVFAGMLWVVALAEEFFFRGLLLPWLTEWTRKPAAALMLSSILFGVAHLWSREFPNWRFAIVAALAGWFYGKAYLAGGGVRAAMVTHALVNVIWKTFFVVVR
ncbi:MAG: CPBP family intramembrane metalloprotease [Bryobacterales bacterium]|nr:CPBP family intramembrane metalloprotease [Bryobacterales bacterium]